MTSRPSDPPWGRLTDEGGAGDPVPDTVHRAGVKAVVTDGEAVLLICERRPDGSVFWTLPGGGIEVDETVREALWREIREELQCDCTVGTRLDTCVYDHRSFPIRTVYAIHRTELRGVPDPNPSEGIVEHAWRHPTDLPPATLDPIQETLETLYTTRYTDGQNG